MKTNCIYCLKLANQDAAPSSTVGNKDFQRMKTLGVGTYGTTLLVRKLGGSDHGRLYAMKITSKRFNGGAGDNEVNDRGHVDEDNSNYRTNVDIVMSERRILEAIRNKPFLAQLHYAFQTHNNLYLILEYCNGGILFPHFYNSTIEKIVFYVAEIILAVEQLHKLGIVHRDLKSDNIVFDKDGHITLIDFGLSVQLLQNNEIKKTMADYEIGTTEFMAPEVIYLEEHGFPVDWWALGVITYVLFEKKLPFCAGNTDDLMDKIVICDPEFRLGIPLLAKEFITGLLNKDQERRLGSRRGAIELKEHPLFVDVDWDRLANKGYGSLINPVLHDETDTRNFFKRFTDLACSDSVGCQSPCDRGIFLDYSYPSARTKEDERSSLQSKIIISETDL